MNPRLLHSTRDSVPADAFRLDFPVRFAEIETEEAAGSTPGHRSAAFAGSANSGIPFDHWYYGKTVVDLGTLTVNRQDLPVLGDHDASLSGIAGYTSKVTLTKDGVEVEGNLFDVTPIGKMALGLLDAGAALQMSVYVPGGTTLILKEGEETEVNGAKFTGPGAVLQNTQLREVTLTALGADEQTSASLLAARRERGGAAPDSTDRGFLSVTTTSFAEENMAERTDAPALDTAKLKNEHPTVYATVLAEGQKAERERVAFIYARAKLGLVSDELVQKAIDEDWDRAKTLDAFFVHVSERKEAKLSARRVERGEDTNPGTDDPQPEVDTFDEANPTGGAPNLKTIAAMPEGTEKFSAEYEANVDNARDDFPGEEGKAEYLAYRRHPVSTQRTLDPRRT